MTKIDPERERKRLADFYAGQMDGELEQTAGQAFELTEIAKEALRAELAKRGLSPELVEKAPVVLEKQPEPKKEPEPKPGDPPPELLGEEVLPEESGGEAESEPAEMVTIRQFRDLPEGLLALGCLSSAGIKCLLVDDNLVRLDWLWSNAIGGVKLKVNVADADSANQILNQPIPEKVDVTGIGEYEQPNCPNCHSLDVTFKELNRPISYMTLWIGVPIPVYRRAWRCHTCNLEWEDDGRPSVESES